MLKHLWKSNWFFLILAAGVIIFYYLRYHRAPDIAFEKTQVTTTTGEQTALSTMIEGPTVVHFYASWCGPCLAEMRELKEVLQNGKLQELRFLFVTDDPEAEVERIKNSMPAQITFLRLSALKDEGIYTLPATYFISSKGEVVKKQVQPCPWKDSKFTDEIISLTQ